MLAEHGELLAQVAVQLGELEKARFVENALLRPVLEGVSAATGQAHVELVGGFHQRALNLGELGDGVVITGADAGGELNHALGHFRRDHAGQLVALQQPQQVGRAGHEVVVVPVDDLQLQLDADAQGA